MHLLLSFLNPREGNEGHFGDRQNILLLVRSNNKEEKKHARGPEEKVLLWSEEYCQNQSKHFLEYLHGLKI